MKIGEKPWAVVDVPFNVDLRDPHERPELLASHLGISNEAAETLLVDHAVAQREPRPPEIVINTARHYADGGGALTLDGRTFHELLGEARKALERAQREVASLEDAVVKEHQAAQQARAWLISIGEAKPEDFK